MAGWVWSAKMTQENWTVGEEQAGLNEKDGSIYFRFHARDLHLVLGPTDEGKPMSFQVTIDGKPLGDGHGFDTDVDRTFEIRFLDPGVHAYAFTFG